MASVVCTCPITKDISVTFTGSTPAPPNGYVLKWRKANSSDAYTQVLPNPTSSPATIPNVPICDNIEVVMQATCSDGNLSSPSTVTVTGLTNYTCGNTISGSHTHNGYYQYASYLVNTASATDTISFAYNVVDKANKFSIYSETGTLLATTDWKGVAAYTGPWGSSLSTNTSGTISVSKGSNCYLVVVVESQTDVSFTDTFTLDISCPSTAVATPTITQLTCSGGYGTFRIDGTSGTVLKVGLTGSGYLTNISGNSQNCARIQAYFSSSTGPSDSENSATVSSSGVVSFGANNSMTLTVTIPSQGYLTISTSVFTVNSYSSTTGATLKIYEVNGAAASITQAVCVYNSTGTVTCDNAPTYYYYNASAYTCTTGCTEGGTSTGTVVVRSSNPLSTTSGQVYSLASNQYYIINSLVTPNPSSYDIDIDAYTVYTNCSSLCSSLPSQNCVGYYITTLNSNTEISYTDCYGTVHTNEPIQNGSYICTNGTAPTISGQGTFSSAGVCNV